MRGGRRWFALLLLLPACAPEAVRAPAPDSSTAVAPVPRLVPDSNFVGAWQAELPAADSPGRLLRLELRGSGAATLSHDYRNDAPAILEAGAWSALGDGRVAARFETRNGRPIRPLTRTFWLDGDTLRPVAREASQWGSAGVAFAAAPVDTVPR